MTKRLVIEIFRPGTHVPMSGTPITFSEADLQASVAGYDKAVHEAPVVIGHPKTDDPAMGWVESVEYRDGGLYATLTDLDDAFAEAIEARRYDKRSPAFYAPDAKGNPKPGTWSLRHVGFLGAQVPGCKGLKPIAFAEEDEATVFAEPVWDLAWALGSIADLFRRQRDQLIEKSSVEDADKVYPDYTIRSLEDAAKGLRDAASQNSQRLAPAFSEPSLPPADDPALAARSAALDEREQAIAAREAAAATAERERRNADDAAFVEGLVKDGKLAPGNKGRVIVFLQSLDRSAPVAFAEGESETTAHEHFKTLLTAAKPIISFAELGEGDDPPPVDAVSLAAAASAHIAEQAGKGITISADQAVRHVQKGSLK